MAPKKGKAKINLPNPVNIDREELAPFLKAKDLPLEGCVSLEILGGARPNNSEYGDGIILDVILDGKKFAFDVKFESSNYPKLFRKFGADPENWTGSVEIEKDRYMGNDYAKVL
jgi:hypothetical protein